ncbi:MULTISPECIES: hypothetical protein [Bizionia]|uniref:hypothetical protein n=1 Tax=Bizionia TaxID=283785 RepID=UPI0008050923|nr:MULTISPECIES: hypothetical protein [Bizionia]OBX21198.1 hypothetical protein BAA08_13540 [Bizionia sp. APA-3]
MPVIKTYPFGNITFHNHYLIVVMKEGVTVSVDYNQVLDDIALNYYGNKKFVYITHRKNSYSVDPNIYFKTSKIKNLAGFAVVFGDSVKIDNTDFESNFISIPFKAFKSLDEAITWSDELCNA